MYAATNITSLNDSSNSTASGENVAGTSGTPWLLPLLITILVDAVGDVLGKIFSYYGLIAFGALTGIVAFFWKPFPSIIRKVLAVICGKDLPNRKAETALEPLLVNPESSVVHVQQQEVVEDRESSAARELEEVAAERATVPTGLEENDSEERNTMSRINLGIGQSATNASSPYGCTESNVASAGLNIGLPNSWDGYRSLPQYGQSCGSSHRTRLHVPQRLVYAGADRYGACGDGGYRFGYSETQSNAHNVQERISVAPRISLPLNLVPVEDLQETIV